jgi:two-component system chemotaxis sensor kinase CheA
LLLIAVHEGIQANPLPEKEHYQVICFNVNDREVGLVATPPVDAAEVTVELDEKTLKQTGVFGSAVLMDRTTLIVDTEQIVREAKPELFHEV